MQHIFLTGEIGVGKSTAIQRAIAAHGLAVGGFRTVSVARPDGSLGVYILPAASQQPPPYAEQQLVGIRGGPAGGPPQAFPQAFDQAGCAILGAAASRQAPLLLMDELGFLERDAGRFTTRVLALLDEATPILGVIKPRANPFLDAVRAHPRIRLIAIDAANREAVTAELIQALHPLGAAKSSSE